MEQFLIVLYMLTIYLGIFLFSQSYINLIPHYNPLNSSPKTTDEIKKNIGEKEREESKVKRIRARGIIDEGGGVRETGKGTTTVEELQERGEKGNPVCGGRRWSAAVVRCKSPSTAFNYDVIANTDDGYFLRYTLYITRGPTASCSRAHPNQRPRGGSLCLR